MSVLVIVIVAWAFLYKPRKHRPKRKPAPPALPVLSPMEIERTAKDRERERKAQQAREIARMELDHLDAQREQLMALYAVMEAERDAADTTPARRNALTRQLIALDDRLFRLDAKRIKKYAVVNAA